MLKLSKVGDTYKNFKLTKLIHIDELQCVYKEIEHLPSGAEVIHICNDDEETAFCLTFHTRPDSSNGVAHILEHTVLCGSKKYPVKDPFFSMSRRSLNTYINALTGADMTYYPAASQVPKDFENLLEVYLDAVFEPNLYELSFLQEGHRLEFNNLDDPNSDLEYKGIVFNEMKGALSSPISRLWEAIMSGIYPGTTYHYNSGGDPKVIPDLTYRQLRDFHKRYYQKGRCLFYFYGNRPTEEHLDFIETHALKEAKKMSPLPPIPLQKRYTSEQTFKQAYPANPNEDITDKTFIALGWLTCHLTEQTDILGLNLLEVILMGTDAAPLKYALLKSGLCKNAYGFLDEDLCEAPYILILEGCKEQSLEEVKTIVFQTLNSFVDGKIPSHLIEAALHQLEFHRSEISSDQGPFGLSLFMRLAPSKQHGAEPEKSLMIHSLFEELHRLIQDPNYLPNLLKRYLINNPHFVTLTLFPDKELATKEAENERKRLLKIKERLSEEKKNQIKAKAKELSAFQKKQEEEDIDVLPKITLKDVSKKARQIPIATDRKNEANLYFHDSFTNNIIYTDVMFPLPKISEQDLPYVRLFSHLLPQVGCGGRDYISNLEYIQSHTGGIHVTLDLHCQANDPTKLRPTLSLQGKALKRKADKLYPLMIDMLETADFTDLARLEELLSQHVTDLENDVNHSAMRYATTLASSSLNTPCKILNDWYGLSYFHHIKKLAKDFKKNIPFISETMQRLKEQLLCLENFDIVTACDQKNYQEIQDRDFYGLTNLKTKPYEAFKPDYKIEPIHSQGRIISSPVAFICMCFDTIPLQHSASPLLSLASGLFDNTTLHSAIREQGGAYGSGASNKSNTGKFYFFTYRDPHLANSVVQFHNAVTKIMDNQFSENDIEEAKLGILQKMDGPISPGSHTLTAYCWLKEGKTQETRQQFRDRLIQANQKDIRSAVAQHIAPKMKDGVIISFADKNFLEKENLLLKKAKLSSLEIKTI